MMGSRRWSLLCLQRLSSSLPRAVPGSPEIRHRLDRFGHIQRHRVSVLVHREFDPAVAYGGHRRSRMHADGRQVRAEGVPQRVDVQEAATGVVLTDSGRFE